jgi:PAS domain S-box-containing protein
MPLFVHKDRKSLFRQFLAGMYDAVVITDPNGHIIEINPRAVEYFGYEQEEVVDRPISFYIPGLSAQVVQRVRNGLKDERHMVIDAGGRNKDGGRIACEIMVSVIDLINPEDLVFTIRNVEKRRSVMNVYRAKANAFRAALCGLCVCDSEGRVRENNVAFREYFSIEDDDAAKRHLLSDFFVSESFSKEFAAALSGECVALELSAKNGSAFRVQFSPNNHGRHNLGVVCCFQKA